MERRERGAHFFEPDAGSPLHGFVLSAAPTSLAQLIESAALADSFSDTVVQMAPGCFYGSLSNTFAWFGSAGRLHAHLETALAASCQPIRVVMGHNFLRTLFHALATSDLPLEMANRENMQYRKFCQTVEWERWSALAAELLNRIALPQSRRERHRRELETFARQMFQMRYRKPFEVPASLTEAELKRRFGPFVADLWEQWIRGRAPQFQLLELPRPLDPESYATSSQESTPEGALIAADRVGYLVGETLFACLEKVKAISTQTHRCGLRDFKITVVCSAHITHERSCSLVQPIFERNRAEEALVELLCSQQRQFLRQGDLIPEWIEKVIVTPGALYSELRAEESLFTLAGEEAVNPIESAFELALLDGSDVTIHTLAATILPETSVITKARFNASNTLLPTTPLPSPCTPAPLSPQKIPPPLCCETGLSPTQTTDTPTGPDAQTESDLFCHVHAGRPCMLLRHLTPLSTLVRNPANCRFQFSEVLDTFDYFVASGKELPYPVWIRSPASERSLQTPLRSWIAVGLFMQARGCG
jgi:hypothetical protein